jgi:DNA invertase Pin-like site-specific DNA recombinase
MTAYGYIRKSVVHDAARMLSPETQEAAIRALAARHGDEDVEILSDLDVSGKKDRTKRPGWNELLRAVEDGEATAVYAYSLSRFARSVSQLAEFFDLCDRRRVAVRVERDHIDTSTATGKLVSNVLASLAQFESDVSSERVKDAFAVKRLKDPGWRGPGNAEYGARDGEDPDVVIEAFREAQSFDGAARLLNERGFPCRVKGASWSGSVVAGVIRRHAPDEVGPAVSVGARAGRSTFRLARVVACSTCGGFLTGSRDTRRGHIRYECRSARYTPHARGWVSESRLLPVIRAEAGRAQLSTKRVQKGTREDEAASATLAKKRARIVDLAADGLIDKADAQRRLAEVAAEEAKLSTRRWVRRIELPPVFEDVTAEDGEVVKADSPERVNGYLRRLFTRATVDMSKPAKRGPSAWVPAVAFEWRDPSLRRSDRKRRTRRSSSASTGKPGTAAA